MQPIFKTDIVTVRLPKGVLAEIDKVLKGGELRAAFIRAAVEAELKRRMRKGETEEIRS